MELRFARTNTPDEALAYWLNRRGTIYHEARSMDHIVSRRRAKAGKKTARLMRDKGSKSMLTRNHPRGMKPTWSACDSHTQLMMSKWSSHVKRVQDLRAIGK